MRKAGPVLLLALLLAACSKEPENTPQAPASAAQGDANAQAAFKYKDPREGVKFKSFQGGSRDAKPDDKGGSQ